MISFTIIIATYNASDNIDKTLNSIINQSYTNYEVLIIDGLSTDDTLDKISCSDLIISHVLSEKDHGIYDAWNKGIKLSNNQWVMFLGAGDTLNCDSLINYANFISDSVIDFDFISSKVQLVDQFNISHRVVGECWNWKRFRRFMNTSHVGSLHNRKYFDRFGLFDKFLKIVGDYDVLLRAGPELNAGFVNHISANMLIGGVSDGTDAIRETLSVKLKNTDRSILLCIIDYFYALAVWCYRNNSYRV